MVVDSLAVGGAERHVAGLAQALSGQGHRVTVACSAGGPVAGLLTATDVRIEVLLDRLVKREVSLAYARELRQLIDRESYDLVHAHLYASEAAAARAVTGTGIPLVLTEHSEGRWQDEPHRRTARWFTNAAGGTIAVSRGIEHRLLDELHVPADRVSLVPNRAAPLSPAERRLVPPAEVLRAQGLRVGVIARLAPEKGHRVFLDAVARIAARVSATFLIAGEGVLGHELRACTRALGLQGRVLFLGECVNARSLMDVLDILVVPSLSEGTPLVVLEGMAAGLPILASRVGGIPDQIRHGREGILVPPGDVEALSDALLLLLRDPTYRRRLGEGALRRAREATHDSMVRQTLEVYGKAQRGESPAAAPCRVVSAAPRPSG